MQRRKARIEQQTARATQRYVKAMARGRGNVRKDAAVRDQVANFRAATRASYEVAEHIKELICAHGVPVTHLALYRSFGLHLARFQRSYAADDFALVCVAAINRWTAYGLDNSILRELCREVFETRV